MPRRALAPLVAAVYIFLYAPILVLVAFSFNRTRLHAAFGGFTLVWYQRLIENPQVMGALRNSLVVALAATVVSTALGTAAALAFHRQRTRLAGAWNTLVMLPLVVPEIVLAASLLLFFATLGLRLGFLTVILAHVAFSVSYAFVVVAARLSGFDHSLEEAAADLGAGPWQVFRQVTLPLMAPGVLAAALLVFSLSLDDFVITSFVAGVGSTTLPVQIYSMVRSGISPEINAVSTLLLAATALLLFASYRLEQGRGGVATAAPLLLGTAILGAPFWLGPSTGSSERVLNLYIWSNYIAPETVRRFEDRFGVRVNLDLYDSNEALMAKVQAGNAAYDVVCPSNYAVQILVRQALLRPLDRSALPHLRNLDPRFVDRHFDPGNRFSVPYLWGSCGLAYRRSKVGGDRDSWSALWDERLAERILMLDDARETLGAALKLEGLSLNERDIVRLRGAQARLVAQKPLVRTYDSANYHDLLLSGEVWAAQGWNGQFAKAIEQDPDIAYVIPKEGGSLFIDNLAIPATSRHPELAHAFIDFTLEAETAAEICRTMRYSSPNRAAMALLPREIRDNPAIFPPAEVLARLELIEDIGDTTVLYDRLWTEVKSQR